ncbi:MAG TPA: C4-dicarboxylate ABC transporter substrate-binding protein, partial [Clostridiales bacterium UBA8153]|nr:C4-dicarboxylate ABC transporter substrate-binding protein [Clostridiales bacterium UBA8153]
MKRKRTLIIALAVVVALVAAYALRPPRKQYLSIATGGTGGVYFPLGGALAAILNEEIRGMEASARTTGASVANANLLAQPPPDGVEMIFIQNDIAYFAHTGTEMFTGRPIPQLRGIATLYPEVVHLVATAASGIRTVRDLVGKRVAVGAAGSGIEVNARQILQAFGIAYAQLGKTDFLSMAEATTGIRDGHLDAAFFTTGVGAAAVTELARTVRVVLVAISGPEVEALRRQFPFYAPFTIAAETYPGMAAAVPTVPVRAMI